MGQSRRIVGIVGVAILVASVVSACSSSSSGNGSGSASTQASGPVTLTMVEYQKPRAEAVEKLLPQFEAAMAAKGQQIKVNLVKDILTDEQFKTKITQQ